MFPSDPALDVTGKATGKMRKHIPANKGRRIDVRSVHVTNLSENLPPSLSFPSEAIPDVNEKSTSGENMKTESDNK